MKIETMILPITTIIMGMTAGIFFCWSVSVTRGLSALSDKEDVLVFQSLNREIQNPLFFMCFLGAAILLPLNSWFYYEPSLPARFWLLLSATIIYLAGVMAVTMIGNVPMNKSLDIFDIASATSVAISVRRLSFEKTWNQLNNIRTAASLIAFILTLLACMIKQHFTEIKSL